MDVNPTSNLLASCMISYEAAIILSEMVSYNLQEEEDTRIYHLVCIPFTLKKLETLQWLEKLSMIQRDKTVSQSKI